MGFENEKLWEILKDKVHQEEVNSNPDQKIEHEYLAGIKRICQFGVDRAKLIRDSFPMFTLHDEVHICNVMRLMLNLLGNDAEKLTRDETAMLVLAACCHDIGMSYNDQEKAELFGDLDRFNQYLDNHHSEYVKVYAGGDEPVMTDEIAQNYLRSIHHERVEELLYQFTWPQVLEGRVDRQDVIAVCQSHGKDISTLDALEATPTVDLRFCAVLLRLADILDFDTSRAPQTVYDYSGFTYNEGSAAKISKEEWHKHMASHGFDFAHVVDRSYPYELSYHATSKSMQIEQAINCYIDWVDQELSGSGKQIKRFAGRWQNFILPNKIKRNIISEGYVSGQYRLTLDQDRVMELLVGKELYSDPAVFVRELIQNAIDAVRTRQQLDKNLNPSWKPQINIRCWIDEEGYHWFRIEDNGIGMTKDVIMNYFLKIGRSYYTSDTFKQEKLRCRADPNYMPISRFGIGILSCFMGDERTNQVEISTKRFKEGKTYYPALRLSMHGMNGYYYLASKDENHRPNPMKGVTEKEKEPYLKQAGTVIAVRTNLYQTGKYRGFKEIVDRYVVYPPVAIHYDGIEGSFDYPTEQEFMNCIHSIQPSNDIEKRGLFEFPLTEEQLGEISCDIPEISFQEPPKLLLKCAALDDYTVSPYLLGAVLTVAAVGEHDPVTLQLGAQRIKAEIEVEIETDRSRTELGLKVSLKLPDEFMQSMELIGRRSKEREEAYYALRDLYQNDYFREEIVEALIRKYSDYRIWQEYMTKHYAISTINLEQAILEVQDKLREICNFSDDSKETLATFQMFEKLRREWKFTLCKLSEFEWYAKYFEKTHRKNECCNTTAHNGVLCGDAKFFYRDSPFSKDNLGTIVLLKDHYCPGVDVARDGVRSITLEMASDFEVIRERINNQGFHIRKDGDLLVPPYCSAKVLWKLLERRPDLIDHLTVQTTAGRYIVKELDQMVQKYGKLELKYSWRFNNSSLYDNLCIAYLMKKFSLNVAIKPHSITVYIAKKNDAYNEFVNCVEDILIGFFLQSCEENDLVLTSRSKYGRWVCNANHPLSQFVIKNCKTLKEHTPVIFQELLHTLRNEEDVVKKMNDLLSHLRGMPGDLINVPVDLVLSEKDLC